MAQAKGITLPIVYKSDPKGLNKAKGQLSGFASSLKKIAGPVAAAFSAAAVVNFAKKSVGAASDLSESMNAVNVAFGDAAEGVLKIGENSAQALGVSQTEFNNAAVRFSAFADRVVGEGGNVAGFIGDVSTRATDFASVFNIDVAEALQVFQSGLAGEAEPLKRFGINLLQSEVQAYALREGLIGVGEQMTEDQKVQARYGLLMEETAKTAGDFANTSDGLANSQRILSANFKDMQAQIGQALLPAFAGLATAMVPIVEQLTPILSETMEQLAPILENVAGIIPSLLEGFLPLLPVIGQIAEVFLQLVGALLPPFAALLQALIPIIEFAVEAVQKFVVPLVEQLAPILTQIIELFAPLLEAILPIFLVLLEALLEPTLRLIEALIPFYEVVLPLLAEVITDIVVPALESFEKFLAVFLPQATAQAEDMGLFPFLNAFERFSAGIRNGSNGLEVTIAETMNSIIASMEGAVRKAISQAKKIAAVLVKVPGIGPAAAAILSLPDIGPEAFGRVEVPDRTYEFPEVDVAGISDAGRRSMAQLADLRAPSATVEEAMQTEIQRFLSREGFLPGGFRSTGIRGLFGGTLPSVTTRARGGLVMNGMPYLVGEMGPELFVPNRGGEIIPNHDLRGGGDTYNITVQAGVGDPVRIGEEVVTAIKRYERVSGPVFASA